MELDLDYRNLSILEQLTSTDLSTASITTSAYNLSQTTGFSMSVGITGSPVGVFKLQGSNNPGNAAAATAGNWDDIPGASYSTTTTDHWTWNISDVFYKYVRLLWTKTSGTGSITELQITAKG